MYRFHPPSHLWALIGILLGSLSIVGCGGEQDWNVVVVTFDTTRADHIGAYGHARIQTPNIDALAVDGVRFDRAFSAVPITAPSHSTIFTGKYPLAHGFRDNGLFVLGDEQETLAEVLKGRGYSTAAAVGSFPLLARFGLDQGFDVYDDHLTAEFENLRGEQVVSRTRIYFDERRAARVNEAIFPWLEAHHQDRFFLWLHYFDPHQPTEPPAPYDQLYLDDLYSGEIAYADEMFGKVIERLRTLGIYDKTLVVFTADHGEGLDEHGESTHSILLYNSTLHVPLIVRAPEGRRNAVVRTRVGTVDILPTVLDLLGIEAPEGVQGRSLAETIRADVALDPVPQYAETLAPRLSHGWGELRALFDGDDKLIFGPRPELYDTQDDLRELDDRYGSESDRAKRLERNLARFIQEHAAEDLTDAVAVDDETRARLMALGYLQGSGDLSTIEEKLRREGDPPQDRVVDTTDFSEAKQFIMDDRFLGARDLAEQLLQRDPDNPTYIELLATSEIGLGRLDEALVLIDRLRALDVDNRMTDDLLIDVGVALFRRGDAEPALERLRQGLALQATPRGHFLEAGMLAALGRRTEEIQALEQALALKPTYVPARVDLAIRQAEDGQRDKAEQNFRRVLAEEPYFHRGHFNYGAFLVAGGAPEDALEHFLRATELEPAYWQAQHAVVAVLVGTGRREEAAARIVQLRRQAPPEVVAEIAQLMEEPPS